MTLVITKKSSVSTFKLINLTTLMLNMFSVLVVVVLLCRIHSVLSPFRYSKSSRDNPRKQSATSRGFSLRHSSTSSAVWTVFL